jgi:hypothetical protein
MGAVSARSVERPHAFVTCAVPPSVAQRISDASFSYNIECRENDARQLAGKVSKAVLHSGGAGKPIVELL